MSSQAHNFLNELNHLRKKEISSLYGKICIDFPMLEAEVKWNAPSFKLAGTNILTFRLFPEPAFQLILHLGSKKRPDSSSLEFEMPDFQNRWADSTRCVIEVPEDLQWDSIKRVIAEWINRVDA